MCTLGTCMLQGTVLMHQRCDISATTRHAALQGQWHMQSSYIYWTSQQTVLTDLTVNDLTMAETMQ